MSNPLSKAVTLTMAATAAVTFASCAGATPLSAGSMPMSDAVAPIFETVQWRGWGGWGGWGWGGFGPATTGAIIGGALVNDPYYGYYNPYYGSPYYYPQTYYSYYTQTYYGNYGGYWPYGLYDYAPSRHDGRHGPVRHH